jgi:hypothetical protein
MISPLARSLWSNGPCDPGTPLAVAKNFAPTLCIVGTSQTAGFGTPSGNAYRKFLSLIGAASGMTITFKGNVVAGDYVPSQRSQGVVGATVPDHLATGVINTPQYFGALGTQHPCVNFLFELGDNDGLGGAADPNVTNYDTNLALLASQLQAKEPTATFGTFKLPRGGDATRNAGIDAINATKIAAAVALIQGAGSQIVQGDLRWLAQLPGAALGSGAQYLGTEAPGWLHWADAAGVLMACGIWPLLCNMNGFAAVYPGDPLT